jgi:YD repeat-containing protein
VRAAILIPPGVVETKAPEGTESQSPPIYSSQFGSYGSGNGQFNAPKGFVLDGKGNVVVADEGNSRVDVLKENGEFVKSFGSHGSGTGQFLEIKGVAVDSKGNYWVVDQGNERLEEFNEKGEYAKVAGSLGSGNGQFKEPKGIAVDSHNNVWVTDYGNDRIEEFNEKGEYIKIVGAYGSGNGQLDKPRELTIDSGGNILVTDTGNNRVEVFNEKGEYSKTFGSYGTGNGQFIAPKGIAVDGHKNMWVTDVENNRVEEFNEKGEYETQFGSAGSGNGQFNEPWGIQVNTHGEVFVSDANNNRIEKFMPAISEAHNSQTIYYSASANPSTPGCGKHPEWANLPCQTQPTAQPQVGLNIPISTFTYNIWGETETSTEKTTVKSGGETTRTSTQTYDAAGRLKESAISSTVGRSVLPVIDEYSEETGALIKQSAGGKSITSAYNTLGQLTSYTDATGVPATYEYEKEADDRLTKTNDSKGTQTYEYDKTTGQITTLKDSGAGTFSATYNPEGQIANETYPNGMKATYTYNPVAQATVLAYTKNSATWYKDETMLSIHGQSLSQTSTLGAESYTYDGIGRMVQAQETPAGKGCTTYLYAYDADSNRVGETKREPGTGGSCATEGGTTTAHSYDEADRLTDPGMAYEPLGENAILSASDAGGHSLESAYYANGAVYSQVQNEQTNTYLLDPAGRVLETTTVKGMSSKSTISHYSSTGSTPAWTETEGSWTRNITGITPGLAATQTNGGEPTIQLANLHGDIIGTVPDNSGAESATLTSEPTAFGVPTTATSSKYSWLGSGGLQTEFAASGIANTGIGIYVPQLGIYLESVGLSGAAAQDPVNEYLADETLAQPTSYGTSTSPGAIEPLPVNAKIEKEWHEHPAWNQPPANGPEELVDPSILLTSSQASWLAGVIREGNLAAIASAPFLGEFGEILQIALDSGLSDIASNIANGLENCVEALHVNRDSPDSKYNRCKLYANVNFSLSPITYGVETCFGVPHRRKIRYYCAGDSLTRN